MKLRSNVTPALPPVNRIDVRAIYPKQRGDFPSQKLSLRAQFSNFSNIALFELCRTASLAVLNSALLAAIAHVFLLRAWTKVTGIKTGGCITGMQDHFPIAQVANEFFVNIAMHILTALVAYAYHTIALVIFPKWPKQAFIALMRLNRLSNVLLQSALRRVTFVVDAPVGALAGSR